MENLERNCSKTYRISSFFNEILAFKLGKLCLRWGFCFIFSTWEPEFCTEKDVPSPRILTEKISGPGLAWGVGGVGRWLPVQSDTA